MNRISQRLVQAIAIIIAGLAIGMIFFQKKSHPTPTPVWQEEPLVLTDIEQATMSGNFTKEFQQALEEEKITPQPKADRPLDEKPIFVLDVPAR